MISSLVFPPRLSQHRVSRRANGQDNGVDNPFFRARRRWSGVVWAIAVLSLAAALPVARASGDVPGSGESQRHAGPGGWQVAAAEAAGGVQKIPDGAGMGRTVETATTPLEPTVNARAYVLVDVLSGQALAAKNPDERVEPASLTKLMTAYLTFQALRQKKLEPGQIVPVSARAAKVEGSRMFIDPTKPVTVDQLIHGVIIQSGNDASIALAEALAGSEEAFAEQMNKQAQVLGLKGTHYVNATGLPHPEHYSTARDLSLMAAAVIQDFPEYYPYYAIKEYRYNNITQPNRNRLLFLDPSVDGMKTGHTDSAGFCLIGSAKRGERRVISVLLGAASDSARTQESQKLLNYGFQYFDSQKIFPKEKTWALPVYKGARKDVRSGFGRDVWIALPKGDFSRYKENFTPRVPLIAPIAAGETVGSMAISVDGRTVAEYPVTAQEPVVLGGILTRAWDSLRLMTK